MRWLWAGLALILLVIGAYVQMHKPFAVDDSELRLVVLNPDDPTRERIGDLIYRGGIDIPAGRLNIGGLSALRWNDGTFVSLTDDGRVVTFIPTEPDGRLIGMSKTMVGPLLDTHAKPLSGKTQSDSESLTRSNDGGWLVGFERDHRIWKYNPNLIDAVPVSFDPTELLGPLGDNNGIEAMASLGEIWIGCAERQAAPNKPNCVRIDAGSAPETFAVSPPKALIEKGSVPTDADFANDGTLYILFRSYSPASGNTAAIIAIDPGGKRREIATIAPPLAVDNFEGLAVRDEGEARFIYLVSDDNFSGSQRTLLMKFEIAAEL